MFSQGDIVVSKVLTPSQINPIEITTKIINQDGNFFAIKQKSNGQIIDQEFVDVTLSPTGDPVEAYERQQGNKLALGIGLTGTAISALPLAGTKIGGKVISGIGNLFGRLKGFTPVKVTKKPYRTVAGQKGFQALPKFDPRSYQYDVQKGPAALLGGTAAATAGFRSITTPEDVQEEIKELEATQTQGEIDDETKQGDAGFEVVSTGEQDKDLVNEGSELEVKAALDSTPEERQYNIFQTKSFSDLMRNIGIKMVETGQIDAGIAEGSALTAIEQKEAEKPKDASDFQEFLAKEEIKNLNKFQDNSAKYAKDLSESIFEVETSDGVLKAITEAKKLVQTGDATGIGPLFREYFNEARRFAFGASIPLSTREAAKNYINDIINGNIKELTGESGRTISNLDRQIAGSLVGKIEWNSSKENVLDKLDKAYARAQSRYKLGITNYEASLKPYAKYNTTPPFDLGKSISDSGQGDTQEKRIRLTIK
tara:strand:- start:1023 stop:2468 length:1446 start_codon:yes stop_codon:yes gene_type:complete